MAKISLHYLNIHKVLFMVLYLIMKAWLLLTRLKVFVSTHFYVISCAASASLLFVNFLIFASGCQIFHSHFFTLKLPHGYLPTFPHHFFPPPSHDASLPSGADDLIGVYSSNNVIRNSLSQPLPPVVHIVSCDHGLFTFANYLSVVSAFKMLKPSAIFLHVKQEPELDPDGYFQFLPDLIRDIPVISKRKLLYPLACSGSVYEQKLAYFNIIGSKGGIALNSKTVLAPSKSLKTLFDYKLGTALLSDRDILLIASAHPGVLASIPSNKDLDVLAARNKSLEVDCQTINSWSLGQPCVHIQEDLFPNEIFKDDNAFTALVRWVGYGTSKKLVSQPAEKDIVPNIVHYVWLGQRNLDFFAYLSILSCLHVFEADAVYIHGDEPLGEFWLKVKNEPRVKMINRDFPNSVYGEPIKRFVSHASDYLRADLLLRYGGLYADWDVLFLKKLPSSIRRHNATASVDFPPTGLFPDVINLGVLVAAPGAHYLRFFLESYRWYLDNDWSYNAIHMPYKIYEKNPQALNIDQHLQVICANNRCHASWIPGFKEDDVNHLHDPRFNWKTDAVAIHWTHPDPDEFKGLDKLLAAKSVEADIGKYILKKANIIS